MSDDPQDIPVPAPTPHRFPKWAPQAGIGFIAVTVVFLMSLVFAAVVFEKPLPDEARFLIVSILALTMAAGSAFLGGSAVASGRIPIGGANQNPMTYSLTGGVVVFAFVLIVGMQVYPAGGTKEEPEPGQPIVTDSVELPAASGIVAMSRGAADAEPQAGEPDWSARPTYARVGLSANFVPDPWMQVVRAGGAMHVDVAGCAGWIHPAAPDVVLDYQAGTLPLSIGASSNGADLMIVVRAPGGLWHCNDDFEGTDPLVQFMPAVTGSYHIWVGTFSPPTEGLPEAALIVTEAIAGA